MKKTNEQKKIERLKKKAIKEDIKFFESIKKLPKFEQDFRISLRFGTGVCTVGWEK